VLYRRLNCRVAFPDLIAVENAIRNANETHVSVARFASLVDPLTSLTGSVIVVSVGFNMAIDSVVQGTASAFWLSQGAHEGDLNLHSHTKWLLFPVVSVFVSPATESNSDIGTDHATPQTDRVLNCNGMTRLTYLHAHE
jgi:hypothetical protein